MTVVNGYLGVLADRINPNGTLNPMRYIQYGTGVTAPAVTDVDLATPITTGGGQRSLSTGSRLTTNTTNDTAVWEANHVFTADTTIQEIAIFTEAAAGVMGIRQLTGTLNVKIGDSLFGHLETIHDQ